MIVRNDDFLKRIERTPLTDLWGTGKNLRMSVMEILREYPQEQDGENFRQLLREILLTESGVTGEELARDEIPAERRNGIERF
jgi:hypothetical protein